MDELFCRCCGNPEAYLFDDGRTYCDLCISNVMADAAYQAQRRDVALHADPWEPAPACTECGSMLRVVEDTRSWNLGAYVEWCPLCGYC